MPICAICSGVVACASIADFVIGSWAKTLTVPTCWTAVIRGRNEESVVGHSSSTAPARPGLRKYAFWSSTTNSNPQRSASRQMKSQSVSLSCWMKSWGSPLESPSKREALLADDLLDDVGRGLVLEHADLAAAVQQVRAVVGVDDQRAAAGAERRLERDDVALEQDLRRLLLARAEPHLERLADAERLAVDALGLRERDAHRADVGEPQVVDDPDLLDPVAVLLRELAAVDDDLVGGDVLLGRVARHVSRAWGS